MEQLGYRYKDGAIGAIEVLRIVKDETLMSKYALQIIEFFNFIEQSSQVTERDNIKWVSDIRKRLIDLYVTNPNNVTKELCLKYAMNDISIKKDSEEALYDILISKLGFLEKLNILIKQYNVPEINARSIIKTIDDIILENTRQKRCTSSNEQKHKFDEQQEELIKGSIKNLLYLIKLQSKSK